MGHYYAVTDNQLIIVKGLENNNLFLIFIPKLGLGSCLYIEKSIVCVLLVSERNANWKKKAQHLKGTELSYSNRVI